jgi:hypothetical protein
MPVSTVRHVMNRLVVAAALVAVVASPVRAQEFGAYHASGGSSLPEFEHADGLGLYFLLHMRGVSVLGNTYSHSNSTPVMARLCSRLTPPSNCIDREMERESRLRGAAVSALVPVVGRRVRLELGGGLSFSVVSATDIGPAENRRSALFTQPTGQPGVLTAVAVRARPLDAVPFVLHMSAGNHHIRLTACGEYPGMDDPFCGSMNLRELRLGVGYDPRR